MGVSLLALLIALGSAGYSATGGNFILGQKNAASTQTLLAAPIATSALRVRNASTAAQAAGINIETAATRPPLKVTSSAKVENLNADKLDGLDSAKFVQGVADGQAIDLAPNSIAYLGPAAGGLLRLRYRCPPGIGDNGSLRIINTSTAPANVFVDRSGGSNPDFLLLGAGGFIDYSAAASGETFSIQAQGVPGVQTAVVATAHPLSSNGCHAQALMMLAR